jgi:hypothetical protein
MRGGDKALSATKAKAKARLYAPFFKNVDESLSPGSPCLTALGRDFGEGWVGSSVFGQEKFGTC